MGVLTDDMARLRGEIGRLRDSRMAFIGDVKEGVAAMLADFHKAHRRMAKSTAAERAEFVSGLKERVAGLRDVFAADNASAHEAWFGSSPAGRPRASTDKAKGEVVRPRKTKSGK
jgi:hypothetical protein